MGKIIGPFINVVYIDIVINFPIVCAVLELDIWNYFSGEQGPTA